MKITTTVTDGNITDVTLSFNEDEFNILQSLVSAGYGAIHRERGLVDTTNVDMRVIAEQILCNGA